MEGARVGVFEDDESWRYLLTRLILKGGHNVVFMATSMTEAQAAIDELEEDSLDVALVDGNLSPDDRTGADGAEITRLLREKVPNITVIGLSGSNSVEGADYSVRKGGNPNLEVPAIITGIQKN